MYRGYWVPGVDSYVTLHVKVRRDLYEKLERYRVPVGEVVQRALEEEVRRREEREIRDALARAQSILGKIPVEEIVEAIRAGREER